MYFYKKNYSKEKSFRPNTFFEENALVYQISEDMLNTELNMLTDDDFRKLVKAKEKKIIENFEL